MCVYNRQRDRVWCDQQVFCPLHCWLVGSPHPQLSCCPGSSVLSLFPWWVSCAWQQLHSLDTMVIVTVSLVSDQLHGQLPLPQWQDQVSLLLQNHAQWHLPGPSTGSAGPTVQMDVGGSCSAQQWLRSSYGPGVWRLRLMCFKSTICKQQLAPKQQWANYRKKMLV